VWVLLGVWTVLNGLCTGCRTPADPGFRDLLPRLPAGFHWEVFDEITVAVATPDGWHRADDRRRGTYTGSVSPEHHTVEDSFATGFSVQVLAGVRRFARLPPSELAARMGHDIANAPENEVLKRDPLRGRGGVRSGFIRYCRCPDLGNKITIHKLFVADDTRDRLYVCTFRSPARNWDKTFGTYGEFMIQHIAMPR